MEDNRIIDFRYAPDHAQVCIGLVDDTYKTIVRSDGSVNWGYDQRNDPGYFVYYDENHKIISLTEGNRGFSYRLKPRILHRDKLISVKQDFGDPGAAIVTTVEEYEASVLTWNCFAWRTEKDARIDVIKWSLECKEGFITTRTGVSLQNMGLAEGLPTILSAQTEKQVQNTDDPLPLVSAGEKIGGAFFIVHAGTFEASDATCETAEKALCRAEEYWMSVKPFAKNFTIPDEQIDAMLRSCGRNILQAREVKDGILTYQVGPTMYRGLWIVDGHFLLEAVHVMGRSDEAFRGLSAVLNRVNPDGSIYVMPGHLKETGIALMTICRQCELTDNDARLTELWGTMKNALGFIRAKRAESYELGEDYPLKGLFGPAFGDGGISGLEPEYTTPVWVLAGLRAAYLAGKRLGLPGFEEFGKEYDDLLSCFYKCVERDRRVTPEGIPYYPQSLIDDPWCLTAGDKVRPVDCAPEDYKPQTGTWALAQAIYPGEVFAPDDRIVTDLLKLLDSVDDTEGIPENTGWQIRNAIWGYSAMFYALDYLYAGDPVKAADYLYAFANHASSGRVWREEQALCHTQSEEICGDMPHNWGSAMFILLVRNMLAMEKLENLELLAGLPKEWLPENGRPLILTESPTKYGKVSLSLNKDEDRYILKYSIIPFNRKPEKIILHWKGKISFAGKKYENTVELNGNVRSFEATLFF